MPVTAREVAAVSGVSVTTVNEILGGRGERYREATRDLVRATADRLGYHRHGMARAVRTGRFHAVALLGASEEGTIHRHQLMAGVAERLAAAGYLLQLAWLPDASLVDADAPRLLREWCSDGLLVNSHLPIAARFLERIRSHRIPSIWINSEATEDAVRPDDAGGVELAVRHLVAAGHRRITWIDPGYGTRTGAPHISQAERRRGYLSTMAELGLTARTLENETWTMPAGFLELASRALAGLDGPDAIVTPDPYLAAAVLHAAALAGRQPPALLVIADGPVVMLGRSLPTCRVPQWAMGVAAVEMLLARIAGAPPQPAKVIPFVLDLPTN